MLFSAFLDTWTRHKANHSQVEDGCSIHLTKDDYKQYIKEYLVTLPSPPPNDYSINDGNLKEVLVSQSLVNQMKGLPGARLWNCEYNGRITMKEIKFDK